MSVLKDEATLRRTIRDEVRALYRTGCVADRAKIPTLDLLARSMSEQEGGTLSPFDLLEWAIGHRLRGAEASAIPLLLGLNQTRGKSVEHRLDKAAPLLGYNTGESLRRGKHGGRYRVEIILDQLGDSLTEAAIDHGFATAASADQPAAAGPLYPLLSTRLLHLSADKKHATTGDALVLTYVINCQSTHPATLWLGASLLDKANNEYSDMHNDTLVTVRHGAHTYARRFTIAPELQPGTYRLVGGLWHGQSIISADAVRFQATDKAGTVVISRRERRAR
jgi:hypothetical protein